MPKPRSGTARYLTEEESAVTGLTSGCIVFNRYGDLMLLLKTGSGWKEMIDDQDWLQEQLEQLWEKQ